MFRFGFLTYILNQMTVLVYLIFDVLFEFAIVAKLYHFHLAVLGVLKIGFEDRA